MKKDGIELKKRYGTKNPFTVPDGYFDRFAEEMMGRLPEKEMSKPQEISLWDRVKPWAYMAAMFLGLMFSIRTLMNRTEEASWDLSVISSMPDEYIDSIVGQTLMDDYELYQYLTDANPNIYN